MRDAAGPQPLDERLRKLPALIFTFSPGRGVLVERFPDEIVVADDVMAQARQHAGVMTFQGNGGIGTKLTVTAANGEAVYEITARAMVPGSDQTLYVAERRSWKLKLAGNPVEVGTYGLNDLKDLFGTWPVAVALRADVLEPPAEWWSHVVWRNDPLAKQAEVTFRADGHEAVYRLFGRHPGHDQPPVYLAQRESLKTDALTSVRLPEAKLLSSTAF